MKVRIGLVALMLAGAVTLLYLALNHSGHLTRDDVLLSVGCSVLQLVATVGFIDTLLERQRRADECDEIAWKTLHDIEAVVWLWLGGSRHFDINELTGLLRGVNDSDALEPFTVNGIISLGARADYTLRTHPKHMRRAPRLRRGMEQLVPLAAIRDPETIALSAAAPKTPVAIAAALLQATVEIAGCVELKATKLSGVVYETDAAPARQRFRERGDPLPE